MNILIMIHVQKGCPLIIKKKLTIFFEMNALMMKSTTRRSVDSQTDMNVEDDIDFSSTPAPKKKKTYTKREGESKEGGLIIHSTSSVY